MELNDDSESFCSGVIRMTFARKASGRCPICLHELPISKAVFSADFRCERCGSRLEVSTLYWRILGLLSVVSGYILAWEIGIHGPRLCGVIPWGFLLLWMPIGFLALMLLVRIAPYLVKPTFVKRRTFESHLTMLNLSSDEKDDPSNQAK